MFEQEYGAPLGVPDAQDEQQRAEHLIAEGAVKRMPAETSEGGGHVV